MHFKQQHYKSKEALIKKTSNVFEQAITNNQVPEDHLTLPSKLSIIDTSQPNFGGDIYNYIGHKQCHIPASFSPNPIHNTVNVPHCGAEIFEPSLPNTQLLPNPIDLGLIPVTSKDTHASIDAIHVESPKSSTTTSTEQHPECYSDNPLQHLARLSKSSKPTQRTTISDHHHQFEHSLY